MADQGCVWLIGHRSGCWHRLGLRPIGRTPALSVTCTAPLQLWYAACGAIQVLCVYVFVIIVVEFILFRIENKKSEQ